MAGTQPEQRSGVAGAVILITASLVKRGSLRELKTLENGYRHPLFPS